MNGHNVYLSFYSRQALEELVRLALLAYLARSLASPGPGTKGGGHEALTKGEADAENRVRPKPGGLPPQLKRQRDRYLSRWAEAMFEPKPS